MPLVSVQAATVVVASNCQGWPAIDDWPLTTAFKIMSDFSQITVDQVRSYWDRRPCNVRHSPKPLGTREYFDEVEARKYFVEPHILRFAEFERWRGKKVLEIGCGIGTDTISFARHGARVTAVDLTEKSLDVARQRARI